MHFQADSFGKLITIKNITRLLSVIILLVLPVFAKAQTNDLSHGKKSAENLIRLSNSQLTDTIQPITLSEAIELALKQASAYQQAQLNEQIAAEDVMQARSAFYPKITANPGLIYTSPTLNRSAVPHTPSFLGANAISEYQGLITTAGEIDTSGKLKATLQKNKFLVESARAGSEIAKRDLITAVTDAYYNLALSTAKRRGAEFNLQSAEEFESYIKLQLDAGEVAPVDLVRARLQKAARSEELEQVKTDELVNQDLLRVLIGYDYAAPVLTEDLMIQIPNSGEIETYLQTAVQTRPEFAQFDAERSAAEQDVKIAQSERKTQVTYSVSTGFISDSLRPNRIKDSAGIQATIGVSIPLFDKGASRSRETQAKLKLQLAANAKILAERQFVQAFYTARTQALSARSRISQIAVSINDAQTNVSASIARYKAGEANIVEVTDAQNTLVTMRQALYQAIFDYQTARAKLLRAIGK